MRTAWLSLALAGLALTGHAFWLSAQRLQPRYDEVSYLAISRDYNRVGGALEVVRCYLAGRCREDNRHPLYQLLLQPVVDEQPRSFADAKLVTWGTGLLLLLIVFLLVGRVFDGMTAAGTVALLGLHPLVAELASSVAHDLLFIALVFAAVYAFFSGLERGFLWWLGAGALVGLAWLTKGAGHLLLIPAVLTAAQRHRLGLFRRAIVPALLLGFVAAGSWLLWRNYTVFGTPFHNFNNRAAWLDSWEDVWTLWRSPEWPRVGLDWYLQKHGVFGLALRLVKGFFITFGLFVYSAGIGFSAIAPRVVTGTALLALAAWGAVRRYRAGRRLEVMAVLWTSAIFFAALSLGAEGGHDNPRYVLPLVLLFLPYSVLAFRDGALPWLADRIEKKNNYFFFSRLAGGGLGAALLAQLAWFSSGLLSNPRGYFAVPPDWHEASRWLASNLRPGEQFALPYHSYYSTWDDPHPDADPRFNYACLGRPAAALPLFGAYGVRRLMVDAQAPDFSECQSGLSPERDAHGPLAFLGFPRCFADSGEPSRFLVYCRP